MANTMPMDEGMDESYSAPVTKPDSAETVDRENEGAETAIVSNKILSPEGEPLKEGDEIVVRVVKNYGDESEIEYAPKEEETPTASPEDQAASEISELDKEGQE